MFACAKKAYMRRMVILSFLAITCLVSCSSPTRVAENALSLVGRGTFVSSAIERQLGLEPLSTIGIFTEYGNTFDSALIRDSEANYFLAHGYTKEIPISSFFYFSDVMFSKFKLISMEELSFDLRSMTDYSKFEGLTSSSIQRMKHADRNIHNDYKEQGEIATWTRAQDVPAYFLKYNLDNKYIAEITVLDLPNEGYRVCSVLIE